MVIITYDVRFKRTLKQYEAKWRHEYDIGDHVIVRLDRNNYHLGIIQNKIVSEYTRTYDIDPYLSEYIERKADDKDLDMLNICEKSETAIWEILNASTESDFFHILDVECQADNNKIIVFFEPIEEIKRRSCDYQLFETFLKTKLELSASLMMKIRKPVWFQQIDNPSSELLSVKPIYSNTPREKWCLVKSNLDKIGGKNKNICS